MNKAILLSIKPKWVAKILNGEKTIEIRKKFPKDYRGWVYIYCSKGKTTLINMDKYLFGNPNDAIRNGKVVARFWCDKVEHFEYDTCSRDICGYWLDNGQIFKNKGTCLSADELWNYIKGKDGYAIHISKLEIFDRPKELSEFYHYVKYNKEMARLNKQDWDFCHLTKAPQNYCYLSIEK